MTDYTAAEGDTVKLLVDREGNSHSIPAGTEGYVVGVSDDVLMVDVQINGEPDNFVASADQVEFVRKGQSAR